MLVGSIIDSAALTYAAPIVSAITSVELGDQQQSPFSRPKVVQDEQRPNIVVIVLDDVGFADTSVFGGLVQTPRLQELAATGLRYNRFHTAAVCSPTRAALLSGRNHHRVGFGGFGGIDHPGYHGIWKKNVASVAEILRRSGYNTAAFGKWHNTPPREITPLGPFDRWPTGLGFEYFYGNMLGKSSQWEPPLWRNTLAVAQPTQPSHGYHLTTDLVDEAIRWIRTHDSLKPKEPYFVYFATGAAHTPHHVPREWSDKYHGGFDEGWDALRERVFKQQKRLGVVPVEADLTPRPNEIPAWEELSDSEREFATQQMELYAGFISHTDHEVGRLIRTLQHGPKADNTLVMYIVGDNGTDPFGGRAGQSWGRDRASVSTIRSMPSEDMSESGSAYALGWAWMGSTPFKWMKGAASHFGATRNPLIISWPARIKDAGGLRSQFSHVVDIAPTLLEAAGVVFPATLDGVDQMPFDGVSLAFSFDHPNAESRHRIQYFEFGGNRAIYRDGWVAAALHLNPALFESSWPGGPNFSEDKWRDFSGDRWELYDVAKDFSQAHDVADKFPGLLDEFRALFDREAFDNHVYPLGTEVLGNRIGLKKPTKTKYVYHGGFPGVSMASTMLPPSDLLPNFTTSHHVMADVSISIEGAEGVILAAGGRSGGLALYVKDGQLTFEANKMGRLRSVVVSHGRLPPGNLKLGYRFSVANPGSTHALVHLMVNGRTVGSGSVNISTPSFLDNFDIGQDSAAPVSTAYQPPFKFTGNIRGVWVELDRTVKATHAF